MYTQNGSGRIKRFRFAGKVLLAAVILAFFFTSCRPSNGSDDSSEVTPTAFAKQFPIQRVTTAAPIPITLEHLAANPDFYIGATLQLTGQFRRLPRLACEGESYPSPATWGLEADGFLANGSGMDEQLRSLLNEGQTITVEGRWLKFEGPVGCQGNLSDQAIWYLSIDRVIDPNPLRRLEPDAIAEAQVSTTEAALPPATGEEPGQEGIIEEDESVTETVIPSIDLTPTLFPLDTPVFVETATVITSTATFAPLPSATAVSGAATPTLFASQTPTGVPGSLPTSTPASQATATIAATATSSGTTPIDKGDLEAEDLIIDTLGAGATDRWQLDLSAGDSITITVAPAAESDLVLSVIDSNGAPLISDQNLTPAGQVETIQDLSISNPGIHNVVIRAAQATQTDYALMMMDSESYSFFFRGTLQPGSTRSDNLQADNDHFWFFSAQSGESISFSITPDGTSDPYIELYDPDGAMMLTIDDNGEGEVESLENYTLLDPGLYGIRVAEFDFLPMSYQITLTKP